MFVVSLPFSILLPITQSLNHSLTHSLTLNNNNNNNTAGAVAGGGESESDATAALLADVDDDASTAAVEVAYAWAMVRDAGTNTTTFFDPVTGETTQATPQPEPPTHSGGGGRGSNPFVTVDCVFNESFFAANAQPSNFVEDCDFDFSNEVQVVQDGTEPPNALTPIHTH